MEINLFNYDQKPPQPAKKITYAELNIHQKINYRANQGVFCGTVYKSKYYYFIQPLHKPKYTHLTKDYYEHYYLNVGGFNRLDNWINANKKELF